MKKVSLKLTLESAKFIHDRVLMHFDAGIEIHEVEKTTNDRIIDALISEVFDKIDLQLRYLKPKYTLKLSVAQALALQLVIRPFDKKLNPWSMVTGNELFQNIQLQIQ
jgi:hypothetical protein